MQSHSFKFKRFSLLWVVLLTGLIFISNDAIARQVIELSYPQTINEKSGENGLPGSRMEWGVDQLPDQDMIRSRSSKQSYHFTKETPVPFTGLAVGWKIGDGEVHAEQFRLKIRSRTPDMEWPEFVNAQGYIESEDSPSGYYWGMLYMTSGGIAHSEFEVIIYAPPGIALSHVRISAADARYDEEGSMTMPHLEDSLQPSIIRRDQWWGNLPENELEPDYTPEYISISHALVHHTVTSNEPPDPGQVLRNIWDWHVNENGWNDIGYNFLIDHIGNIYQGRFNPSLMETDVRGAHTSRANGRSVGIALIGQFEPGASPASGNPQTAALDALTELIAWRFSQNNIDPLGVSPIPVNPDGSSILPHISAHRDVSATACPGEHLYTQLPDIRQNVAAAMEHMDNDFADGLPAPFELIGNYPNPFSSGTSIRYSVEEEMHVRLELYTYDGRKIKDIYHGTAESGEHEIDFETEGLASGIYIYRMVSGGFNQTRQLLYLK
jgi:hypothetical protein